MERRPAPPKEYEDLLSQLTEPNSKGDRVFETKQKAMMFAAALGFSQGTRSTVVSKGQGVRWEIFERDLDGDFLDALAVAETGDLNVLREDRENERVDIFEEYAHGGLAEMQRLCVNQPGEPSDNLIRKSLEVKASNSEIPGIDADVLKGLLG